jgi:mutator protein MutT
MINKHGIVFVIITKDSILLQKRTNKNGIYFGYNIIPGGKVKKGESEEEALVREVKEEADVQALSWAKLGKINFKEKGRPVKTSVFIVNKYKGQVFGRSTKMGSMFWSPYRNVKKVCKHPISRKIVRMVDDYLSSKDY